MARSAKNSLSDLEFQGVTCVLIGEPLHAGSLSAGADDAQQGVVIIEVRVNHKAERLQFADQPVGIMCL